MTLRVAITRASPDAEGTAERLKAMGAAPVIAPLLTIVPRAFNANVEDAQALLLTSAAGVRAPFRVNARARQARLHGRRRDGRRCPRRRIHRRPFGGRRCRRACGVGEGRRFTRARASLSISAANTSRAT
jgi:hypothetical protein